jgi:hypothetical protein
VRYSSHAHTSHPSLKHHRFPAEIISHGVWLYYRLHLSYRDVQELLFERGIAVTHEAHGAELGRGYSLMLSCGPQLLPLRIISGSARLTPYGVHATQRWTPVF